VSPRTTAKPPVNEAVDQNDTHHQGLLVLFYRAALPLSSKTLKYAAGIVRRHRASIGSLWRKLNPGQQALLVLAYLRKGETFAELAAVFGVGTATAWRYVNETVELLAARAPKLRKAVRNAKRAGYAYVVLDGTLIPIDRVAVDRPFYSGKHKRHGINLQVIASPTGDILWVSGALPGSVHDKKAEWIWGVLRELEAAGLITLADKGYQGTTWAKIPYRGKSKPESQKEANRAHAKLRAPGERANAQLKKLEDPPQAPLLSLACRATRQGHPRPGDPRSITRMKKAQCLRRTAAHNRVIWSMGVLLPDWTSRTGPKHLASLPNARPGLSDSICFCRSGHFTRLHGRETVLRTNVLLPLLDEVLWGRARWSTGSPPILADTA
jgi:hypothetical protein